MFAKLLRFWKKKKKCQKKRTFISSFMILFHFLHSWNQVPFLWFLGYSQWSQVPFQHLQCLLISWLCDKRASLVLELSVGLGYFYGLWTPDQHSPPSDQHFPPRHQKLFSSSASRALFSELVFSLCCSRLKVPVSQELTCRLLVSFKKLAMFRFFFGNKNWGILFIDKNPLWKTFFFWLNAMMFTKFTNLKYRSPFKWQEKLQCEWRNSVFLIITGCGKSQFEFFFFARNMLFLFPEPKKGTRTNTNLWYVSKLTTVPKTKEMSQKLRVSLLRSLLDVFWMLLEPSHQAFTETTKLVAKKPQKVWFYCIEGAMTSHLPKHSQHKSWIFVFTFHNPQQQNKSQKDPRKDKDVTGGEFPPKLRSSVNHSRKKKRLSMKLCEDVTQPEQELEPFQMALSVTLESPSNDGCGRVLASTSLKETQKLLIWSCEAASTHSRWSCWFISGQVEITAPTGVSKDLSGQS